MTSQILIAMDDRETTVRLNAAFEAAKFSTAMFSSLDDARGTEPQFSVTSRRSLFCLGWCAACGEQ